MGVLIAFFNGVLENDIYIKIPDSFKCDQVFRKSKMINLKKVLYGLKISSKRWNRKLSKELHNLGVTSSECTFRFIGLIISIVFSCDLVKHLIDVE